MIKFLKIILKDMFDIDSIGFELYIRFAGPLGVFLWILLLLVSLCTPLSDSSKWLATFLICILSLPPLLIFIGALALEHLREVAIYLKDVSKRSKDD